MDYFERLLASGRAFRILPDGTIDVPAGETPVETNPHRVESRHSHVESHVETGHVENAPQNATGADSACVAADVETGHVEKAANPHVEKHHVEKDVESLSAQLHRVLELLPAQPVLTPALVATALDITSRAAYNLLQRLVGMGKLVKGCKRGTYHVPTEGGNAVLTTAEAITENTAIHARACAVGGETLAGIVGIQEERLVVDREITSLCVSNTAWPMSNTSFGEGEGLVVSDTGQREQATAPCLPPLPEDDMDDTDLSYYLADDEDDDDSEMAQEAHAGRTHRHRIKPRTVFSLGLEDDDDDEEIAIRLPHKCQPKNQPPQRPTPPQSVYDDDAYDIVEEDDDGTHPYGIRTAARDSEYADDVMAGYDVDDDDD